MKCFEGESVTDWLPEPPAYSALALWCPTVARTPHWGGQATRTQPAPRHPLRKTGGQCRRSGMPRSSWPSCHPVRSGRGGMKNSDTPVGAAGCPSSTPLPKATLHRHPGSGRDCQRKWGLLGVWPWSSGKQPQGLEAGTIG